MPCADVRFQFCHPSSNRWRRAIAPLHASAHRQAGIGLACVGGMALFWEAPRDRKPVSSPDAVPPVSPLVVATLLRLWAQDK